MLQALLPIARAVRARGGRALVVGGFVRDRLLGVETGDLDVEVLGLAASELDEVLGGFGTVRSFGRAFAVRQVEGLRAQFSLPRRDSLVGDDEDARDLAARAEPDLSFEQAARRRDLTINAMGLDPLTDELLDPLGGRADLEARVLRAADPARFADDPLRGLRVVQLAARFGMTPDDELLALCRRLHLGDVPGERLRTEFEKLLLLSARPSVGLEALRHTHLLRFFPELAALVDVPQDPEWHPEGDVWIHTGMALDAAAELRLGTPAHREDDLALLFAVLCHDFGKPATTRELEGRIRSKGHSAEGVPLARAFMQRLRASNELTTRVEALVEHHLAPSLLRAQKATPKAYRKLARRLDAAGVTPELLERVARADHWGRTTEQARERRYPAGEHFLRAMREVRPAQGTRDVVQGRHLRARGVTEGPEIGRLLARCREVQDETGATDPDQILAAVLDEPPATD